MTRAILSLSGVLLVAVLLILLGTPVWQTNDDPGMAMAVHGFGIAAPGFPPWLIHSNIIWGWLARWMPDAGNILGYTWLSYLALLAALWAILYCLSQHVGWLTSSILLTLPAGWSILLPQYTVTAGLLTLAAILMIRQYQLRQDEPGSTRLLAGAILLGLAGYLVRDLQFFLTLLIALPYLPFALVSDRKALVSLAMFLILALGAWEINRISYQDPA